MKKTIQNWIALLTALCLLCGAFSALGEGAGGTETPKPTEVQNAVAASEAPATEVPAPTDGGGGETKAPAETPTPAPAATPEATSAPTPEATEAPAAAMTTEPTKVFIPGYVRLSSKTVFYAEDGTETALDRGGIAYAFEYSEKKERVCVAFNDGGKIRKAWVEEKRARLLDAEEIEDYYEDGLEGAVAWKDFWLCPLHFKVEATPAPEPTEVENIGTETTLEPTAVPEATASVEPTAVPEATASVEPTAVPERTASVEPTATPETTASVEPTAVPEPTASVEPTAVPEATVSVEPTVVPEPTASVEPTAMPEATVSVEPTAMPEATASVEPTAVPEPTPTMEIAVDATKAPDDAGAQGLFAAVMRLEAERAPAPALSISGTPELGQTLTASAEPETFNRFQWYRADNDAFENPSPIDGATGASHVVIYEDVGAYLYVTATDGAQELRACAGRVRLSATGLQMDYAHEQLCAYLPDFSGELRFFRSGSDDLAFSVEFTESICMPLRNLEGAPLSEAVSYEVRFVQNGEVLKEAELNVPARPAFAGGANPRIDAKYTTAAISGDGGCVYALSLPEAAEPALFADENGAFAGLTDGARYAVWARNPAAEGSFASPWTKLEGVYCETLPRVRISASFDPTRVETDGGAVWTPGLAPFDARSGVHFLEGGVCVDDLIGGNVRFEWRDAAENMLVEAPVDAGVYRLVPILADSVEKYVLDGEALRYVIAPLNLEDSDVTLLESAACVYNGELQLPREARVGNAEYTLPAQSYALKFVEGVNASEAGEAGGVIVGVEPNVTGVKAFGYRIDPRPVKVLPEQIADYKYTGGTELPLSRENWALEDAVEGDDVRADASAATAAAASAEIGSDIPVVFSGVALAGDDAGNYVIGELGARTVNIVRADAPEIVWPEAGALRYGQKLSESALTGGSAQLGSFAWADGNLRPSAGQRGYAAVFVPKDMDHYAWNEADLRRELKVEVKRRKASVIAGNFSKSVGEGDPSLTAATEGLLSGDRLEYSLKRKSGEAPGKYAISVVLGENPNYDVTAVGGMLTIEARSLNAPSISVSSIPRQIYTGSPIEPRPVVRDGRTTLQEGVDYTIAYNGNRLEGVATATLTGIGNYGGSRTVSFTIYKLSSTGGVSNDSEVEGESASLWGDEADWDDGQAWDAGAYEYLLEEEKQNDPLYDGYLGTGEGLNQLNVVRDADGAPADYELLPVRYLYAQEAGDAFAGEADPFASADGTLLIYAGPDPDGEAAVRELELSGAQLARLYQDQGMSTLLFRNCDAAVMLDIYEMLTGDAAKLAGQVISGEINADTDLATLDLEALPDFELAPEELFDLYYVVRSAPVLMENGETGYDLSVWFCCGEEEIEISALLPMLCVCANVEGLFEAGEEEDFLNSFANARLDEDGEAERLEGDLMLQPDELPEGQADAAECFTVISGGETAAPTVHYAQSASLDMYRCQTLISAWAGPGVYLLLDESMGE